MKSILNIWALCFLILPVSGQMIKEIYVSPNGSDTHTGSKKRPFKTLQRANRTIASLPSNNSVPVTVWMDAGTYRITEPIIIDSTIKKNTAPVTFKALPGAKPVIKGSVEITNWEPLENGLWLATLPQNISPFRELFVAEKRAVRARHPNKEYLRVKKVGADKRTYFSFHEGDFPIPQNYKAVELALLHDWSMTRIPIKQIDQEKNEIHAVDSIGAKVLDFFNLDQWEAQPRYYLENALEFLDADYEWYLDAPASNLYLKLPQKMDPSLLSIEVPQAEGHLHIVGNEENPISNISFEGITFKHAKWNLPNQTYAGIQACFFDPRDGTETWKAVPAAISTIWADHIRFEACEFSSLGGSGVWFGTGSSHSTLENCTLYDISGNGIMIGEGQDRQIDGLPWWQIAPQQAALGNRVSNSNISECGKQFYGAVGIWGGLTAETILNNNEIHNLPYTGISMGWMWSPEVTPCRDNRISNNHIHHIMRTLSDGGGIYILGLQPGSILAHNLIHDISVNAGKAESNGMFLDEGIKDVVVENNLIYNIAKSPLRFHKAFTNLIRNNYLFPKGDTPGIAYNSTNEESIVKINNQIISTDDTNYKSLLSEALLKFKTIRDTVTD